MKKFMLIMFVILFATISGWTKNHTYTFDEIYLDSLNKTEREYSQTKIDEMFYLENIPKEYADAFIYYTRKFPQIRRDFYSLMRHESQNFTAFYHKNADGSVDKGPSQLNSNNIKSKTFRDFYNPTDESHITSVYCYYMVMTINFYYDLVMKYGQEYAFYGYNGGEPCIKWIKTNNYDPRYEGRIKAVKEYDTAVRNKRKATDLLLEEYTTKFKFDKAFEMAMEVMNEQNNCEISQIYLFGKYFIKFGNNRFLYIRREDLIEFKFEEIGIICNPSIGALQIQTA